MKQPSRQSRTSANLSWTLDHRLNLYSLAASAAGVSLLALVSPAQARIVFTPAHIKLTPNHKLAIDFNHDGVKDFEFLDQAAGSSDFLEIKALQTGNALAQANTDCNPSVGVAALKAGVLIGKGQTFSNNIYCMAQYIGASAAASLLAFIYGQRATDHGLHQLSIVMGAVSAFLLIATLFDRTIPRITAVAAEPVATTH